MIVKGKQVSVDGIGRILVIQLGDIGDVVLTTPTMKTLRENFVSSRIFMLVHEHAGGLVENCPWVDGTLSVDKTKQRLGETIVPRSEYSVWNGDEANGNSARISPVKLASNSISVPVSSGCTTSNSTHSGITFDLTNPPLISRTTV